MCVCVCVLLLPPGGKGGKRGAPSGKAGRPAKKARGVKAGGGAAAAGQGEGGAEGAEQLSARANALAAALGAIFDAAEVRGAHGVVGWGLRVVRLVVLAGSVEGAGAEGAGQLLGPVGVAVPSRQASQVRVCAGTPARDVCLEARKEGADAGVAQPASCPASPSCTQALPDPAAHSHVPAGFCLTSLARGERLLAPFGPFTLIPTPTPFPNPN